MGACNLYSKAELICPNVKPKAVTQITKQICGRMLSIVCKQVTPDQAIQDALINCTVWNPLRCWSLLSMTWHAKESASLQVATPVRSYLWQPGGPALCFHCGSSRTPALCGQCPFSWQHIRCKSHPPPGSRRNDFQLPGSPAANHNTLIRQGRKAASGSTGQSYGKVLGLEKVFLGKKYLHVNCKGVEPLASPLSFLFKFVTTCAVWTRLWLNKKTRIYIQTVLPLFSNLLWPGREEYTALRLHLQFVQTKQTVLYSVITPERSYNISLIRYLKLFRRLKQDIPFPSWSFFNSVTDDCLFARQMWKLGT